MDSFSNTLHHLKNETSLPSGGPSPPGPPARWERVIAFKWPERPPPRKKSRGRQCNVKLFIYLFLCIHNTISPGLHPHPMKMFNSPSCPVCKCDTATCIDENFCNIPVIKS